MERVIVIGGGYAGVLAALRAAARLGSGADVLLVSDSDALVERIRLHESAASGRGVRRPLAELVRGTGVRLVHARCESIDRDRRTLVAGDTTLSFDRLIVAIGSEIDRDAVPGARAHAHDLSPEGTERLRGALAAAASGAHVVVAGGGLTGLEAATEIAESHPHLRVTLLSHGEVGERLSRGARAHVLRALARLGVALREGVHVDRIEEDCVVTGGERIAFDLCVSAIGFRAPDALRAWGFPLDARGRARVDAELRLEGAPHVYVAGDCAAVTDTVGSPVVPGCKTAMPMGARAAENAAASLRGQPERALDWIDTGCCTSLGRRDAVIQVMDVHGRPREALYLTGRTAALVKELVCRYTVQSVLLERDGRFRYRYLSARRPARADRYR